MAGVPMSRAIEVNPVFSSYVASIELDVDNKSIKEYCLDLRKRDKGSELSNVGGWQSSPMNHPDKKLEKLIVNITETVKELNDGIGFSQEGEIKLTGYWVNLNSKYNHNEIHVHPASFYSAVYYVDAAPDQGNLVFFNLIQNLADYFNKNIIKDFNQFTSIRWNVVPKTGLLVIFPSYLLHFVQMNMTDKERISIAFNYEVKI
jgi:uncharacterized protein (TIGR02466 family)